MNQKNILLFFCLFICIFSNFDTRDACPIQTGSIFSDKLKISIDGNITVSNKDNYCYNYPLIKTFKNIPSIAIALNKFQSQNTKNLFLSIKPLNCEFNNQYFFNSQSNILSTLSFSVNLYKAYTKWTLIQFYFLAQDKLQIQSGYQMIDGSLLECNKLGKSIQAFIPFKNQFVGNIQAATFLNGFQINSLESQEQAGKFSPLEVQIINKCINKTGIKFQLSVTTTTNVMNILVSYIAFSQRFQKSFIGSYIYDPYQIDSSSNIKTLIHSPKCIINQLNSKIFGISGFVINSNQFTISFNSQLTSTFSFKINNFWKYFSYQYAFFLGGICTDCQGFPIFYQGKCIDKCPPQFNFNGYTCIQCSLGQNWNGTHCINRCNGGKIWINQACICPNNTEWNGYSCSPCPLTKIWSSILRICICSDNKVWNGTECINCTGGRIYDSNSQSCICPSGSIWTGTMCFKNCINGQIWNSDIFKCQCPNGLGWDGLMCIQCNSGRYYNNLTKTCDCLYGLWNGTFCLNNCFNGKIYNSSTNQCQCPKRSYQLNNQCITCGTIPNDFTRKQCQCQAGTYFNGYSCVLCDKQRVWDQYSFTCVCPMNKKWNGTNCVSNKCGQGYLQIGNICYCPSYKIQKNGKCSLNGNCTKGYVWNTKTFKCQIVQCQAGSVWNGDLCQIKCNSSPCPHQTYWNGFYCSSMSEACPTGTKWNGKQCTTTQKKCTSGTYWTGSICQLIPSQCPSQMIWQKNQKRCIPINNTCPNGTYLNVISCIPYTPCKNGQIWSKQLVQCVCSQNSHFNGQICVSCLGNQIYGLSGCECPVSTFWNGLKCVNISSINDCKLIKNAIFNVNNSVCECKSGFDKVAFDCICNGITIGSECEKCSNKPYSNWNGLYCQCKNGYFEINGRCKPNSQLNNNTNNNNQTSSCSVGTYFQPQQQKCLLCSDGCLSCTSCAQCQQCRPEYNYFLPSKSCVQLCGDGKRFSLQCDDGNNYNGDGCSSDCKIQPQYTCFGGSPNSKDQCKRYKPEFIDMKITGQTHLYGKVILNVKLNYLPTNLTLSEECMLNCDKILLLKLIEGQKSFLSIKSEYIKSTSYTFSIQIDFGREPINNFMAQIQINPKLKDKYFNGIDITKSIKTSVQTVYMAKFESSQLDMLK